MPSLNCFGCNKIAETGDLILAINATRGPRLSIRDGGNVVWSWSAFPTVTRNIPVCSECLKRPEMAVILELISPPWSQSDGHSGDKCAIICRHRRRMFWARGLRQRLQLWPAPRPYRCPGCNRVAILWPATLAPVRHVRELAELAAEQQPQPRRVTIQSRPALPEATHEWSPNDE